MMSTLGLEVLGVAVPFLKWKLASNGRQRAARQRRRNFSEFKLIKCASQTLNVNGYSTENENSTGNGPKRTAGNRTKSTVKSSKQSQDFILKGTKRSGSIRNKSAAKNLKESHVFIDKGSKKSGDTLDSDPEKVGVKILDRRFSGNLESCPVKKRRIHLVHSPSSHNSEEYCGLPLIEAKFAASRSTKIPEINEGLSETPDTSNLNEGLSETPDTSNLWLLATIADKIPNAVFSVSSGHASDGEGLCTNVESDGLSEVKEEQLFSASGVLDVKTDTFNSLGKVQNASDIIEPSRNGRSHWDLNRQMDEWGSSVDEIVNAKSPAVTIESGDGICHKKVVNIEAFQVQMTLRDAKDAPVPADNIAQLGRQTIDDISVSASEFLSVPKDEFALLGSTLTEKTVLFCDSSFVYNKEEECALPSLDGLIKEQNQLHGPVVSTGMDEGTECLNVHSTIVADAIDPEKDVKTETYPLSSGLVVETETQFSCQTLRETTSIEAVTQGSELLPGGDQRALEVVLQENVSAGSAGYHDIQTAGCDLTKVESSALKKVSLHTDLEAGEIDQHSNHSHLGEEACDVLVNMPERNKTSQMVVADGRSGEFSHTDVSDNDISDNADNSRVDKNSCSSGSRPFICQASSPRNELSSGSTSVGKFVVTNVDVKIKNSEYSVLADESVNVTKSGDPIGNSFNQSNYELTSMMQGMTDVPDADGALSSHGTHKSCVGGFMNSSSEGAVMDHADCGYDSNVSQTVNDQVIGVQNVVLPSDDDSQYEDGEIRGSIINDWREDDDSEEIETGYVDYGSDNRDVDVEPAALHFGNVECKNRRLSEICDGTQVRQDAQGHHNSFDRIKKFHWRKATDPWESATRNVDFSKGSDGVHESSHSANMKVNSSVWDQWPDGCRNSRGEAASSSAGPANNNKRQLSSRIERPDCANVSHSKNRYYAKSSRCDDAIEQTFKFGNVDHNGSLRRGQASFPLHSRGHGATWVDSQKPACPDTLGYNGSASFSPHGSKSVVPVVAAQLESNGFVMAPDGTIFKARPARSQKTGHTVRRRSPIERDGTFVMHKQFDNRREMSPDKHINGSHGRSGRYGSGVARTEQKKRYHGPMSYQQQLSRREQSFSPNRRSVHLSRSYTRSSRSRTPPRLTPPRGGSDNGIDRSPIRRNSRSSFHFRSEVINERMGSQIRHRMRSPHQRTGFKRVMGFTRPARDHISPPYVSRQTVERNEPLYQLKGRDCRRSSGGRRERAKGFVQDQPFCLRDSPEGLKPDKGYPLLRSGRLPDSVNVNKGARHDNDGDQRTCHGDNYEKLPLMSNCGVDDSTEDIVHGVDHGTQTQHYQKFSSESQRIGSPTRSEGHFDSELRDSPQTAVESGDPFRCGGNGNNGFSFKSSGVRDCDDDMASLSRPS